MNKERNAVTTVDMKDMTSEELEQLIYAELDGARDPKVVRDALRLLRERDSFETPVLPRTMDVWNKYKQLETKKSAKRPQRALARVAAVAAVVIMLVSTIPSVFGAENIFVLIGRWSRELFSFVTQEQETSEGLYAFETNHPGLQELYDVVSSNGITQPVVPMWIPEGYQLEAVREITQIEATKIVGMFSSGDGKFVITIEQIKGSWQNKFTKDESPVDELEIAGITHYIVSNTDKSAAIWHNEGIECYITTSLDIETLKAILISVYSGG